MRSFCYLNVMQKRWSLLLSIIVVPAVLLVWNTLLGAHFWLPDGRPLVFFIPVYESLAVVTFLAIAARVRRRGGEGSRHTSLGDGTHGGVGTGGGRRGSRLATVLVGAVAGYLLAYSAAETLFRYIYARPFLPRTDLLAIRSGLYLVLGTIGDAMDVVHPVVTVFLFVATAALGVGLAAGTRAILSRTRGNLPILAGAALVAIVGYTMVEPPRSVAYMGVAGWVQTGGLEFVEFETPELDTGAPDETDERGGDAEHAAVAVPAEPEIVHRFPGILDKDIYVFVIEAYGYATYSRDFFADAFRPVRGRLREALAEKGYGVRTSFLRSPVAGGFSWLAEATLFTGQWIPTTEAYADLYELEELPSLTRMLYEGGYYTLTVRPGTVHDSWPEGWDLYRFEESMIAHDGDFDFNGPMFSYVWITDQFAIWAGHNRIQELTAAGGIAENRPVFAHFQLVSSHTPFNRIPPIIEDWDDLEGGDIYWEREDEIQTFDNTWTTGNEWHEGYTAAVTHSLDVVTKYVTDLLDTERNPIIIILGDHQAQRPIRENRAHLSVPIHVASRDPEILGLFAAAGYSSGMTSSLSPPHPDMSTFFRTFAGIAHSPPIPPELEPR